MQIFKRLKFWLMTFIIFVVVFGLIANQEITQASSTADVIGKGDAFTLPTGVAVDPEGNVYVTDQDQDTTYKVIKMRESGSSTWNDITYGTQFTYVGGITSDDDGNIYVASIVQGLGYAVMELEESGGSWTAIYSGGSQITSPVDVAVDHDGNVYVVGQWNQIIKRPAGDATWQAITYNVKDFNLFMPAAIDVDSQGNLFVSSNSGAVELPAGTETWIDISNGESLSSNGIAVDSNGNVFVFKGNSVVELPTGQSTWNEVTINKALMFPRGIAIDSDDKLYITQQEPVGDGPPSLTADTTNNKVAYSIDITYTEDSAWASAITEVNVDGSALQDTDYSKSAGTIEINAGALSAGYHTIIVKATGYYDTMVSQQIIDVVPILTDFTWAPGSVTGATQATAVTAGTLKFVIGAAGTKTQPYAGDIAASAGYSNTLAANTDIAASVGQHLFIVRVDSSDKITGWADVTVVAANVFINKGDVNGDGHVTPADALYVTKYMKDKVAYPLTEEQIAVLDMNDDHVLDSKDIQLIMQAYLGGN